MYNNKFISILNVPVNFDSSKNTFSKILLFL